MSTGNITRQTEFNQAEPSTLTLLLIKKILKQSKKNYEKLHKENDQQNSVWVKENKFPHL